MQDEYVFKGEQQREKNATAEWVSPGEDPFGGKPPIRRNETHLNIASNVVDVRQLRGRRDDGRRSYVSSSVVTSAGFFASTSAA